MTKKTTIPVITEIPSEEQKEFDKLIKSHRKKYIRTSQEIVNKVFSETPRFLEEVANGNVSKSILELRELVWSEYLKDEVHFNVVLMQDLHEVLKTPKYILKLLVNAEVAELPKDKLLIEVRRLCGEYSGRVFPYIYKIALSLSLIHI